MAVRQVFVDTAVVPNWDALGLGSHAVTGRHQYFCLGCRHTAVPINLLFTQLVVTVLACIMVLDINACNSSHSLLSLTTCAFIQHY